MKILCSCGAKFVIDVTPEMERQPVQFICPACGLDSSTAVNQLIQQELSAATISAEPSSIVGSPANPEPPSAAPRLAAPRIHVALSEPAKAATLEDPAPGGSCVKHAGQPIAHQCLVCSKAMCPKCMELFGYVCSPFCRSRAEARKMKVPVYAGQKSVSEARLWRKVGWVTAAVAGMIGLLLGSWVYYEWFASRPSPHFAVQFPDGVFNAQTEFCGPDQMIFLHGVTLSRYDLKGKKEVWARELISASRLQEFKEQENRNVEAFFKSVREAGWDRIPAPPTEEDMMERTYEAAADSFDVFVQGSNVWLNFGDSGKLVLLNWETGADEKEIAVPGHGQAVSRASEKLTIRAGNDVGQRLITHVNLASGEHRMETVGEPVQAAAAGQRAAGRPAAPGRIAVSVPAGAGLPGSAGADRRVPMDPARVAADAQRLSLPEKIALPAIVANAMNQERIFRELDGDEPDPVQLRRVFGGAITPGDSVTFVPNPNGDYGFAVRLLEERLVERVAMKEAPKTSALDGEVNASKTQEIANELLNEMQRNRGGDKVVENESRYRVTVHAMDGGAPDWSGEVIGRPRLLPLQTITLVAGNKSIIALDRKNKKLWEASFANNLSGGGELGDDESMHGQLPCAERDGRIYICDLAMLTSVDAASGNVHWRLPTVGIAGLLFDHEGMLYVNTTTASPESIRYSRQIDVTSSASAVIVKVDSKTGKSLWSTQAGGFISYLSGKFLYVASWNDADDLKDSPFATGMETPSYVRIKRLDPDDGRIRWDHYQKRAPLGVHFKDNHIQIIFKKEMQVLKYFTF